MRWRRVRLIVLASFLVLLVAWVGTDLWAGRRLAREVARLEQRYGKLLMEGSVRSPGGVPSADNRARVARAAAALVVSDDSGRQYQGVGRFLGTKAQPPVPAEVRTFVEANRPAVGVAEGVRARRRSSWEADYESGHNFPGLMDLRTLANAIAVSALIDLQEGRPDAAAHAAATGLAVASTLREEPPLICQLIRIAVTTIPLQAVQQIIVEAEPSGSALEDLAGWLAENRSPSPAAVGLLGELRSGHKRWSKIASGRIEAVVGETSSRAWLFGPIARLSRPFVSLAHRRYLQLGGRLLEIQGGPRPRPDFAPARPPGWLSLERFDVPLFTAGLERSIESGDTFVSQLNATETAVALRRFRLEAGSYPDDLAALVPKYLPAVPIDPFTGRPPAYARKGAGFELHAEGPKNRTPRPPALDWIVTK